MRKFVFRLDLLLRMRLNQEQREQIALAEATRTCTDGKERLVYLERERERTHLAMREARGIAHLQEHSSYLRRLEKNHDIESRELKAREEERVRRAESYAKAYIARREMDYLREKAYERHRGEAGKEEMKKSDELGSVYWRRQRHGEKG